MTETTAASPRSRDLAAAAQDKWPATSWLILSVLLVIAALRCWVAARSDLEADEAYYWLWSRHLAASYFDHPPMVAYLTRLGTWLAGDSVLGIRSMALLATILASALLYVLAVTLFGDRRIGLLSVLWFNVPPYAVYFGLVMFPDTPAILFWVLTCVGLALVWRSGRGEWWYLVGVAMGLLLLSKYTGVFLALGIVAWLLLSTQMRRWLKRPEPYIAGLIALILFSPVILWNAQHGWVSFIKQFGRALHATSHGGLANMAAFVGVQAGFLSPLIFIFVVAGIAVATWRGLRWQQANWLLLAVASAPTLLYFFIHSLSSEVLAQWPSAAYPAAIVAGVAAFAARADNPEWRPVFRYSFRAAPWLGFLFSLSLCAQMTFAPLPISAAHDPNSRFFGWAGLASDTRAIAKTQQADYIASSDYCTNATLAFYLRDISVFQAWESVRYTFLPPVDQALLRRTNGIFVEAVGFDSLGRLRDHFDAVELVSTIWRNRKGDPIEPYRVYSLKGYRGGLPLLGRQPNSSPTFEC
jgi:4-amino-4-deoxy-L-arabinose transferase-like glycosyltransferase